MKEKKTTVEHFPSKKKDKKSTLANYGGALKLKDIRSSDGKEKTKNS